jgi:F-type H+-transporting ATPase subunit alpha
MLKQDQFSPLSVENQVAIIYASTKGFLDNVPVKKVREFEKNYLSVLNVNHKNTLSSIASGN